MRRQPNHLGTMDRLDQHLERVVSLENAGLLARIGFELRSDDFYLLAKSSSGLAKGAGGFNRTFFGGAGLAGAFVPVSTARAIR